MPRSLIVIVLACAGAILTLGGAVGSAASPNERCTTSGPSICVDIVGDPATVPPSEPDEPPHFVSYSAQVVNNGPQAATHVTADLELSGGLVLVSATPSAGSCSVDGNPTCTLGRIAGGGTVTIEFVARVPLGEGPASAKLTASFDETANDGPTADPKQDTVSSTENTTIEELEGTAASFVPQGASASLTTDPSGTGVASPGDPLIGDAHITSAPTSVVALIEEVAAPVSCPRRVICRGGDWLFASIPGTYFPPLAFPLRWDASLIPSGLTAKKFALIYTECLDDCPLQVISKRCTSASPSASELPCLTGVAKLADGDWRATLLSEHNGYMH
jgi:Domain of unknown function DUF11